VFSHYIAVYPEIIRPNAVTAISGKCTHVLHTCEWIFKILSRGKGVKASTLLTYCYFVVDDGVVVSNVVLRGQNDDDPATYVIN